MHDVVDTGSGTQRLHGRRVRKTTVVGSSRLPTVVTIAPPSIQTKLDVGGYGLYEAVHLPSVSAAIAATASPYVQLLLLSPDLVEHKELPMVRRLVVRCHGMGIAAVVAEGSAAIRDRILDFGACGVRHVVDLSTNSGWDLLRILVSEDCHDAATLIHQVVQEALLDAPEEARSFFTFLVRIAPRISSLKEMAVHLRLPPSTLASQFFRARVASPKQYLSGTRLLYASALLENEAASVATVALRLRYSSPQAFARTVRVVCGMSTTDFRREFPFRNMCRWYTRELVEPHRNRLPNLGLARLLTARATSLSENVR